MKIIMLPNRVVAIIVFCKESTFVLGPSPPCKTSSAGSLYEYEPWNKSINISDELCTVNEKGGARNGNILADYTGNYQIPRRTNKKWCKNPLRRYIK